MIVTLSTSDLGAHENPNGVIHCREWHAHISQLIADRRIFPRLAFGRHHCTNPYIIRFIRGNRLLHPLDKRLAEDDICRAILEPKNVGPVVVGVADVTLRFQQVINQFLTFCQIPRIHETLGLTQRRYGSRRFQIDPSDELFVRRFRVRFHLIFLVIGGDELVDLSRRLLDLTFFGAIYRRDLPLAQGFIAGAGPRFRFLRLAL